MEISSCRCLNVGHILFRRTSFLHSIGVLSSFHLEIFSCPFVRPFSTTLLSNIVTMSVHVNDMDEFKTILKDAGDTLVVVDFYATWCGPCRLIAPVLEELATEHGQSLLILKVDIDECEEIAAEYNISSMPTFIFLKNEKVLKEFSGASVDKLKEYIATFK